MEQLTCQAREAGISPDCQQRMQLVIEELFANTINHGHGSECDAPVRLAVFFQARRCRLLYRDSAPPFNLLQTPSANPLPAQIGGVGIHLIRRLTKSVRYLESAEGNRLELTFEDRACLLYTSRCV